MEELKGSQYDDIDMRNAYNSGFWIGATASGVLVMALCFFVGFFVQ